MYLYLLCFLLCSIETIIVSLCVNKDIIIMYIAAYIQCELHVCYVSCNDCALFYINVYNKDNNNCRKLLITVKKLQE